MRTQKRVVRERKGAVRSGFKPGEQILLGGVVTGLGILHKTWLRLPADSALAALHLAHDGFGSLNLLQMAYCPQNPIFKRTIRTEQVRSEEHTSELQSLRHL